MTGDKSKHRWVIPPDHIESTPGQDSVVWNPPDGDPRAEVRIKPECMVDGVQIAVIRRVFLSSYIRTLPTQIELTDSVGVTRTYDQVEVPEADIVINGKALTSAQAMAVRVAVTSLESDCEEPLGDDEHGRRMAELYRERCAEVLRIMLGNPEVE